MQNEIAIQPSEREISNRIIHMHDSLNQGFRKIAKQLSAEGTKISKDTVCKLYHRYKTDEEESFGDEELQKLRQVEAEALESLRLLREKESVRKRVAELAVELAMTSYEVRRGLFLDERKLLTFAETVMPVAGAQVWTDFKRTCELYHIDLAHWLSAAVGLQRPFEEQLAEDSQERMRLDAYLVKRIREALMAWNETEEDQQETEEAQTHDAINEEEEQIQEKSESTFSEGENEEYVAIEVPIDYVIIEVPIYGPSY